MALLDRYILIVDDEKKDVDENIENWEEIIDEDNYIKNNYKIIFKHIDNLNDAHEYIKKESVFVDTLIMDFNFNNRSEDSDIKTGLDLIKEIRSKVNKNVKIIFYTNKEATELFNSIENLEELINLKIYQFVSKAETNPKWLTIFNKKMSEAIISALKDSSNIISAFEHFLLNYESVLDDSTIEVKGRKYSPAEILKALRKDEELGQDFLKEVLELPFIKKIQLKD